MTNTIGFAVVGLIFGALTILWSRTVLHTEEAQRHLPRGVSVKDMQLLATIVGVTMVVLGLGAVVVLLVGWVADI